MLTFKKFLESSVSEEPRFQRLELDETVKLIRAQCSDALWMFEKNRPIWRGEKSVHRFEFAVVDTSATKRVSQNTTNHYTLIFDNLRSWKTWPKRSRSFICSASQHYAAGYAGTGLGLFAIIPFNGVKIGDVGEDDMWDIDMEFFDREYRIVTLNSKLDYLDLPGDDWSAWVKYAEQLKNDPRSADAEKFKQVFSITTDGPVDFMKELERAYAPATLGFKMYTTATLPHSDLFSELWVSGNVVMIRRDEWDGICTRVLHS